MTLLPQLIFIVRVVLRESVWSSPWHNGALPIQAGSMTRLASHRLHLCVVEQDKYQYTIDRLKSCCVVLSRELCLPCQNAYLIASVDLTELPVLRIDNTPTGQ